jgi:hypothetical protein
MLKAFFCIYFDRVRFGADAVGQTESLSIARKQLTKRLLIGFYEQSIPIEIALHEESIGEEFAVESATLNEKALGLQDSNGNIWQKTI